MLDSQELLDSTITLTPQKGGGGGGGGGDGAAGEIALVRDLFERLPEALDLRSLKHKLKGDENPLNVVLVQEVQRYGVLLKKLRAGLASLELGLRGLVVISEELEAV